MNQFYPLFLIVHLFAAIFFVGTVFFEVIILEKSRKKINQATFKEVELVISRRLVKIMPWVIISLYLAGIAMVFTRYTFVLSQPFQSTFAVLLSLKIMLALSVFIHFLTAMRVGKNKTGTARFYRNLHLSVFAHVLLIVILAKLMFYLS